MIASSQSLSTTLSSPNSRATGRLKVLFIPLGYVLAHVSRPIQVAAALRARGHDVVFVGDDPDNPRSKLGLVRQAGFRLERAPEPNHPYAWDHFIKYGWLAMAWDLSRLQKWAPLDKIIDAHVQLIEREKPDIIVGDGSASASTAAYITKRPVACIQGAYFLDYLNSNIVFRQYLDGYDRFSLEPLRRRVYRKYGCKPVRAMRLLCSIPLISPDLPSLYDPSPRCPHYYTVGPILFDHPAPIPPWMNELADGTPNVYVSMGSTGIFDAFLRRTFDALGRLPYRFLVTTGGQVHESTMRAAPANFRFAQFAPGSAILKYSRAMIYHGGNGTMYQALAEGVPMITLPAHREQVLTARHAARHGFSITLNARKAQGNALAAALREVVEDPSYRAAAQRFVPQIQEWNGAERAADVIEQVAKAGKPAGDYLI